MSMKVEQLCSGFLKTTAVISYPNNRCTGRNIRKGHAINYNFHRFEHQDSV